MTILVIAEHDHQQLNKMTLSVIAAAQQLAQLDNSAEIHLCIAGENCQNVADQGVTVAGVSKVLLADHAVYGHFLAENMALLLQEVINASSYSHVVFAATSVGKNCMPRLAALLQVEPLSDVMAIESSDTFQRPIYAGNAIATVKNSAPLQVMTIRATSFDAMSDTQAAAPIETLAAVYDAGLSQFIKEDLSQSERPELTAAEVIVSGGRGVGSGENFDLLYELADKLGAAVGASRAAVDAGFVANDLQVGQTGKIVAPNLYIAAGISGAIQHQAGMKESKVIVAINSDEEAPIFQIADYGMVADLFDVVPELVKKI